MTLTAADRQTIEYNRATFEKLTVKGLSALLTEQKVPGRSKAKTRAEKIELLMAQTWGYKELQAEEKMQKIITLKREGFFLVAYGSEAESAITLLGMTRTKKNNETYTGIRATQLGVYTDKAEAAGIVLKVAS